MKKAWLICAAMVVASSAMAQTAPWGGVSARTDWNAEPMREVDAQFTYFFPSQQYSGFYDQMYGLEAQYRYWFSQPYGVAFSLGLMSADVRRDNRQFINPSQGVFKDSAQMIPLGVSGLYNLYEYNEWQVNLEAGLRYVLISSDVKLEYIGTGASETVDMDNAWVAVIRFDVDRVLTEQYRLFLGAGVQVDISAGDLSTRSRDLGGNNLKGYSLSLGAKYLF